MTIGEKKLVWVAVKGDFAYMLMNAKYEVIERTIKEEFKDELDEWDIYQTWCI